MSKTVCISDISVKTVRKDIKNIHLGVYPPDGKVRMAIPTKTSNEYIRLFLISKERWIKKKQAELAKIQRPSPREYVTGETHYVFGKKYRLDVIMSSDKPKISIRKKTHIEMYVRDDSTIKQREKILEAYYRSELNRQILKTVKKLELKLGVKTKQVKVRKMKTKWGTCNPGKHHITLNLELVKKPTNCIEYVIVHELTHLLERKHSEKFNSIVKRTIPNWKSVKNELNSLPIKF